MTSSSYTFTLSGRSSILSSQIYPPLEIYDQDAAIALIGFDTYNSIPNVTEENNVFRFQLPNSSTWEEIVLPRGQYEIEDISEYILDELQLLLSLSERSELDENDEAGREALDSELRGLFNLSVQKNTLRCIISSNFVIDFTKDNSIGKLLGFIPQTLQKGTHTSENVINISNINIIRIDCNLSTGSYINGVLAHSLYEFYPRVPSGYKILEQPQNLIYLPLSKKSIDEVSVQILDQDGNLVSFDDEIVTVRLHLKVLTRN